MHHSHGSKNILHEHYVAKLRTFLLDITNFLSITNSTSAFFIAASQCDIILSCMCYLLTAPVFENNHFFATVYFYRFLYTKL